MTVQVLKDVEEALKRDLRNILYGDSRTQTSTVMQEKFDIFTGDQLTDTSIEPSEYHESAGANDVVYPRAFIRLLSIAEDKESGREIPPFGQECVSASGTDNLFTGGTYPRAFAVIFSGADALTTDGSTDSTIQLTHRKIRNLTTSHQIRLLSGDNQGTYNIDSITLSGNGPHTATLSSTIVEETPALIYDTTTGVITFTSYVDLNTIAASDTFTDADSSTFTISAISPQSMTITITTGETVAVGSGGDIARTGDILQSDDSGADIYYLILDPDDPIVRNGTAVTTQSSMSNWSIPFNLEYLIEVSSKEKDDHLAVGNRMMEVFYHPRGYINVILRISDSAETALTEDGETSDTVLDVTDATGFNVNDPIRIMTDKTIGETTTITEVNTTDNQITISDALSTDYTIDNSAFIVTHADRMRWERDFIDHETDDDLEDQFWVHRFIYIVEAWLDPDDSDTTTAETVHFVTGTFEDLEDEVEIGPGIDADFVED